MTLKSEIMSKVLTIMLLVLVAFSAINLISTIVYAIDLNLYIDYVYSIDGFVNILSVVIYYIILVIYLIWIYRVHMDLNTLFPHYPRTPGKSLVCMMVPFYSFYGIPSTYSKIGEHLQKIPSARKQGFNITGLTAPLIIFFLLSWGLNRVISKSGADPSSTLLLIFGVVELITHSVYLALCINVSRGLKNAHNNDAPITPILDEPADWVSSNLTNDAGLDQKA